MIQRKQTLFLLFAIICSVFSILLPIAHCIPKETMEVGITFFNLYVKSEKGIINFAISALFILNTLSIMLNSITIISYKNRKKQSLLCGINMCLLLAWYGFLAGFIFSYNDKYTIQPTLYIAFPLIALIFIVMAYKGIKADEKLVRSLDRIR